MDPQYKVDLQEVFAMKKPVVVLGPGCHRIGYDDEEDPGWKEVVRRVGLLHDAVSSDERDAKEASFLEKFWISHLSDETRNGPYKARYFDQDTMPREYDISSRRDNAYAVDRCRTALARFLLRALHQATVSLGETIARGMAPVIDWQLVAVPENVKTGRVGIAQRRAGAALKTAEDVATLLINRAEGVGPTPKEEELEERLGLALSDPSLLEEELKRERPVVRGEPTEALRIRLETLTRGLKMSAVVAMLGSVRRQSFGRDAPTRLSGALVEWLGDLLWHVLTADVAVPPSQNQLAFYVNLHRDAEITQHGFSRPRPGDYRADPSPPQDVLSKDVRRILRTCYPKVDWTRKRDRFALAMAASLVVQWRHEKELADDEGKKADKEGVTTLAAREARPPGDGMPPGRWTPSPYPSLPTLALALVTDYDVTLEHALFRLSSAREVFHVILPVWLHEGAKASIEWLIGTFPGKVNRVDAVTNQEEWRWVADSGVLDELNEPVIKGPVVVKLSGSPLHKSHGKRFDGTPNDLGIPDPDADLPVQIRPATIFSEFDSLRAIESFRKLSQTKGLGEHLFTASGLSWGDRSWLFFGQRFADWIPRLRLFSSSQPWTAPAGTDARGTSHERVAVDRAFNWPERTLLRALGVRLLETNLGDIADYWDQKGQENLETVVEDFLGEVETAFRTVTPKK